MSVSRYSAVFLLDNLVLDLVNPDRLDLRSSWNKNLTTARSKFEAIVMDTCCIGKDLSSFHGSHHPKPESDTNLNHPPPQLDSSDCNLRAWLNRGNHCY